MTNRRVPGIVAGVARGRVPDAARERMRRALLSGLLCVRGRLGPSESRAELAAAARNWMLSTERTRPLSFEGACAALGIDPSYLRKVFLGPLAMSASGQATDTAAFEEWLFRASATPSRPRAARQSFGGHKTTERRTHHGR